jgi:hypothetical protein
MRSYCDRCFGNKGFGAHYCTGYVNMKRRRLERERKGGSKERAFSDGKRDVCG